MIEQEWLASDDPREMMEALGNQVGSREYRLFLCACCRRIWHLLTDSRTRRVVEMEEQFLEGGIPSTELEQVRRVAARIPGAGQAAPTWEVVGSAAGLHHPGIAAWAVWSNTHRNASAAWDRERASQCHLLRDIFGNPFRALDFEDSWLTPAVLGLAQEIYEERWLPSGVLDVSRLCILADALQDADCDHFEILDHCRHEAPHVRGCWVIDLLLNKRRHHSGIAPDLCRPCGPASRAHPEAVGCRL